MFQGNLLKLIKNLIYTHHYGEDAMKAIEQNEVKVDDPPLSLKDAALKLANDLLDKNIRSIKIDIKDSLDDDTLKA